MLSDRLLVFTGLQTEVLRGELGFDGFVVSDYEADLELIDHGYAANESDAAYLIRSNVLRHSSSLRPHLTSFFFAVYLLRQV